MTKNKNIRLNDDLKSIGIWLPTEYGLYSVNDVLSSNLSMLSDDMRYGLIKQIHALGLKFDAELTMDEIEQRSIQRENTSFSEVERGHRIDYAYQCVEHLEDFISREKTLELAMKNLPETSHIDDEEAEAWLKFVSVNRKIIESLDKKNSKILHMLKDKMNLSIK